MTKKPGSPRQAPTRVCCSFPQRSFNVAKWQLPAEQAPADPSVGQTRPAAQNTQREGGDKGQLGSGPHPLPPIPWSEQGTGLHLPRLTLSHNTKEQHPVLRRTSRGVLALQDAALLAQGMATQPPFLPALSPPSHPTPDSQSLKLAHLCPAEEIHTTHPK